MLEDRGRCARGYRVLCWRVEGAVLEGRGCCAGG